MKNAPKRMDVVALIYFGVVALLILRQILVQEGIVISNISSEVWVAIAAAIIALCALGVSIHQIRVSERHNRLSVRPRITTKCPAADSDRIGLALVNNGLGPAIIRQVVIKRGSITSECDKLGFTEILLPKWIIKNESGDHEDTGLPGNFGCNLVGENSTLAQGDSIWLIFHDDPAPLQRKYWVEVLQGIEVIVIFESMYGDETFKFEGSLSLG